MNKLGMGLCTCSNLLWAMACSCWNKCLTLLQLHLRASAFPSMWGATL